MSYDYERYDGKKIVVDGEIIGVLAMEFGHEVEEVWEEYHAELAMTEEQERQSEAYKESLRRTLSAQYEKVATLETENAKLREQLEKSEEGRERQADNLINKYHTTARLQDDNAKLRKQSERLFDKTLELASENSKLRELCKLCEREAENAKLRERICKLESLAFDTLSFTLACVWHLNEIAGYERMEPSSPATATFESLLRRAKELGVPEV